MRRVLLTGMSGTGKSTVIRELATRGYKAVDADEGGLSELVEVPLGEPTGLAPGQDWVWREDRIQDLLSTEDDDVLFLSGCSPNQGKFYPQFDHIVLLTAPASVIVERLATRTTNTYGKHPDEVARTLQLQQTVEPLLRRAAALEVDTSAPLDHIVAAVLRLVQPGMTWAHPLSEEGPGQVEGRIRTFTHVRQRARAGRRGHWGAQSNEAVACLSKPMYMRA